MELQSGLVYGPVQSRRLGRSLGVNLCPAGRKTCNFNCAYCQYGWTNFPAKEMFPRPADVIDALDAALQRDPDVDSITVAGNGEPTLHPAFVSIADGLFHARERLAFVELHEPPGNPVRRKVCGKITRPLGGREPADDDGFHD